MNVKMYEHPATQRNLDSLRAAGFHILGPDVGELACQEEGAGRLVDLGVILETAKRLLTPASLEGRRILVSAGPPWEPFDPVRFISNRSTGKMGFAVAEAAVEVGARVVLVSGPVSLKTPAGVERIAPEVGY